MPNHLRLEGMFMLLLLEVFWCGRIVLPAVNMSARHFKTHAHRVPK